jgi:hypothetical protein
LLHRRAAAGAAGLSGDAAARYALADALMRRAELHLQAEAARETAELLRELRSLEEFRNVERKPETMQRLLALLPLEARHAEITGDLETASAKIKEALTILPPPSTPLPAAGELRRMGLMSQLARYETLAERGEAALAVAAAALGVLERTGESLSAGQHTNLRAALMSRKGAAERRTGALDDAEQTLREALDLLEGAQAQLPKDDLVEGLETVLTELGETLKAKGQDAEGRALVERAAALSRTEAS